MDHDVIRVRDQYYILSTSSLADDRVRVLKHGETFAVCDRRGDIEPVGQRTQGLYHQETRFLSQWVLRLDKGRPLLLSSAIKDDNLLLAVDLTNPDLYTKGRVTVPRGTLHISRSRFLWKGTQYERLRIVNYSLKSVEVSFSIQFSADFADIFEVRGLQRQRRGEYLKERVDDGGIALSYQGLDGVVRRTRLECSPRPQQISPSEILLGVSLPPRDEQTYVLTVSCEAGDEIARLAGYDSAFAEVVSALQDARNRTPHIYTSNEQFNDWLNRSAADIHMMMTDTPHGLYPYAGVPWFSTAFGRDGIITAMETLWLNPAMARGVLSYLAATQAVDSIAEVDAEPGKILHEARKGEMAQLKEVPFRCYYGSVDSTPLFVMLAGRYYRRTGDMDFIESIWPNIEGALHWIDHYGDVDGDGFVEYARRSSKGLVQQGWKDSSDSVFHRDGSLADGPIALCEVQGYVYAAKREAAEVALALGFAKQGERLQQQAQQLQQRFERAFWCEELSTYALALDGKKQPCQVRTSNAGHCLFTGIASQEHAELVARTLLDYDSSFSGWGIRTVSAEELRYSPMSYHNGSIWPHDNALIAAGMARYGLRSSVAKIASSLLDASLFVDLHRLPELFCGFNRRPGEGPTLYPVACSPQSWAAASVFLILEACLGVSIQGRRPQAVFTHFLPESLHRVRINNLQIGAASVDLSIQRSGESVDVTVSRKQGEIDIVSGK